MKKFLIKKCTLDDIEKVKYISENTFYETFAKDNSKEDMESYLKENFSYQKIKCEIENDNSIFFIVQNDDTIAAYMKVNFNKAQTEIGHKNTLEIQRIYVLNDYKGKSIGKMLIEKAKEVAEVNKVNYIWLGVWENNIKAISFYEKRGFVKFDTHVFKLGEDEQTDYLMKYIIK